MWVCTNLELISILRYKVYVINISSYIVKTGLVLCKCCAIIYMWGGKNQMHKNDTPRAVPILPAIFFGKWEAKGKALKRWMKF